MNRKCRLCKKELPIENYDKNEDGEYYKGCRICLDKRRKYRKKRLVIAKQQYGGKTIRIHPSIQ